MAAASICSVGRIDRTLSQEHRAADQPRRLSEARSEHGALARISEGATAKAATTTSHCKEQ
jgi:hypothetical protein